MKVRVKLIEFGTTIQNQSGGSYNGTLITYESNGKTLTKGIATKFMDSPQQAELKAKLEKLSKEVPKDVVFITTETESNGRKFTNFVDVLDAGAEDTSVRHNSGGTRPERTSSGLSSSNTGGKNTGGGGVFKDVTIARSVGIKAAVDMGINNVSEVMAAASKFASYIVQPLGVDANGNKLTVNNGDSTGDNSDTNV